MRASFKSVIAMSIVMCLFSASYVHGAVSYSVGDKYEFKYEQKDIDDTEKKTGIAEIVILSVSETTTKRNVNYSFMLDIVGENVIKKNNSKQFLADANNTFKAFSETDITTLNDTEKAGLTFGIALMSIGFFSTGNLLIIEGPISINVKYEYTLSEKNMGVSLILNYDDDGVLKKYEVSFTNENGTSTTKLWRGGLLDQILELPGYPVLSLGIFSVFAVIFITKKTKKI